MPRIILLLALFLVLVPTAKIRAQSSDRQPSEVWPEFTVNYDPIRKIRLMWAVRKETSDLTPETTVETTLTFIYRVKPFVRDILFNDDDENDNERKYMLSFAANYEFTKSFGPSSKSTGQKLMLDATPRYSLPGKIMLQNRGRVAFRWAEGERDIWFLDRLRAERAFKIGKFRFRPYAYGEIAWTKNTNSWDRNNLSTGVELPVIRKRAMVDLYYLRKNCDSCSFPDVNAIGINFHLFFGRR